MEEIDEIDNIQNDIKNQNASDIDYSVFNTLSLMSQTLGECYKDDGYNPFPEGYEINEQYIDDILQSKKTCKKIENAPVFVDMGFDKSKNAFKTALENTKLLKEEMIKKSINSAVLSKKECDKILLYLNNRQALLEKFLSTMRKGSNILEMLQELDDLDPRLAEILKATYYRDFNLKIALDNLVLFIMKEMERQLSKDVIRESTVIAEKTISSTEKTVPQESQNSNEKNVETKVKEILESAPTNKIAETITVKKVEKQLDKRLQNMHKDRELIEIDIVDTKLDAINREINKYRQHLKGHNNDSDTELDL